MNQLKLVDSNLSRLNDWPENEKQKSGFCASVALNRLHQIIMKSSPCKSVNSRFICHYCKYEYIFLKFEL